MKDVEEKYLEGLSRLSIGGTAIPRAEIDEIENQLLEAVRAAGGTNSGSVIALHSASPVDYVLLFGICIRLGLVFLPLVSREENPGWNVLIERKAGEGGLTFRSNPQSQAKAGAALWLRSSGTENAKYHLLTRKQVIECAKENVEIQGIGAGSNIFCSLSLCHVGSLLTQVLPALLTGAGLSLCEPGGIFSIRRAIVEEDISHFHLTPYILRMLCYRWPGLSLTGHRAVLTIGSSRVSAGIIGYARQMGFRRILHYYGLTEAPPPVAWSEAASGRLDAGLAEVSPRYNADITGSGELVLRSSGETLATGDFVAGRIGRFRIIGRGSRAFELDGQTNLHFENEIMALDWVSEVASFRRENGSVRFFVETMGPKTKVDPDRIRILLPKDTEFEFSRIPRNRNGKVIFNSMAGSFQIG